MSEPYISRYLHSKGAALGLPIMGNFELTPSCNFNCKMCYVHLNKEESKKRGKELSMEDWLEIARRARDQGMLFLLLTGGEPFLRKDFIPLYLELQKMGFMISINSNGSLIEGEILEVLKKNPPHRLNITLYGASNETYQSLCGVPAYERVKKNIGELVRAGIMVRLNASLTPYNKDDLDEIFQYAAKRELMVKATAYMNPPIRVDDQLIGTSMNRFTAKEAAVQTVCIDKQNLTRERFCERAEAIQSKIKNNDANEEQYGVMRCRAGRTSFWLTWDGRMLPCGLIEDEGINVREYGFDKAWEMTKSLTKEIRLPKECSTCDKKDLCIVCAAMCQSETGRFDKKPEYICEMMEEYVRRTKEQYDEWKPGCIFC